MAEKTLVMVTEQPSMRAEVHGWDCEDSSGFVPGKHIGMTPGMRERHSYDTVLEAQYNGWKLLSPPLKRSEGWEWWFTKE